MTSPRARGMIPGMRKGLGHPARREALFGGKGEVLVWDLLGAAQIPPFTAVLACELAPGASIFVAAAVKQPDGTLEVPRVNVGRGVAPPM